jgi:hypothetical protein
MKAKILEAINKRLFGNTALKNALSSRIYYARGPVSATWPQMIYFDVTDVQGYLIDFDSMTVQFSVWATTAISALNLSVMVRDLMTRMGGQYALGTGTVYINFSQLIDAGELPGDDQQLYGQYLRVKYNYRGTNIGG